MKSNEFNLIGRVGWLDLKLTQNDKPIMTINLGIKNSYGNYENFFIKFFNNQNRALAEEVNSTIKEGDYIRVSGKLSVSSFIPRNADKKVEKIELIGFDFAKVTFDKDKKEWVDEE